MLYYTTRPFFGIKSTFSEWTGLDFVSWHFHILVYFNGSSFLQLGSFFVLGYSGLIWDFWNGMARICWTSKTCHYYLNWFLKNWAYF